MNGRDENEFDTVFGQALSKHFEVKTDVSTGRDQKEVDATLRELIRKLIKQQSEEIDLLKKV